MWIGIECGCEVWELERGAAACDAAGVPRCVGEMLRRAGRLLEGGAGMARNGGERLLEIERRAAEAVERVRAERVMRAGQMIGRLMGEVAEEGGCGAAGEVVEGMLRMAGIGTAGWRGGRASGGKNGGVAKRRRGRLGVRGGTGVVGADGSIVALAGKAEGGQIAAATAEQWERYGRSFSGWCAVELKKMGFKMTHVARGLGTDVSEAWRCVSGWERYWKAMGGAGVVFGGPEEGWEERLEAAVGRATGVGVRGRPVTLSGGAGVEAMGGPKKVAPRSADGVAEFVKGVKENVT